MSTFFYFSSVYFKLFRKKKRIERLFATNTGDLQIPFTSAQQKGSTQTDV